MLQWACRWTSCKSICCSTQAKVEQITLTAALSMIHFCTTLALRFGDTLVMRHIGCYCFMRTVIVFLRTARLASSSHRFVRRPAVGKYHFYHIFNHAAARYICPVKQRYMYATHRLQLVALLCLLAANANAQYAKRGTSIIGFEFGRDWVNGSEYATPTPSSGNSVGYYKATGSSALFFGDFSRLRRKPIGFNWGYYAGFSLGGTMSKWKRQYADGFVNTGDYQSGFDFNGDMRIGLQAAYKNDSSKFFAGIRYYQVWQAKTFYGEVYGNADDAACIGAFASYRNFGLDLGYGSGKFPGVLVKSDVWDFLQCSFRYRFKSKPKSTSGWVIGLNYQYNILRATDKPVGYGTVIIQQAHPQSLYLFVAVGNK